MSCYKPRIRAEDLNKWETANDGHKYHPAKIFDSGRLEEYYKPSWKSHYKYTMIPCGQCIGCRLDYAREWANRGYLEMDPKSESWFITLTYDEDHVPYLDEIKTKNGVTFTDMDEEAIEWKGCLEPKDATNFMKRLRKHFKQEYDIDNIKFMLCGEYGGTTERPHMHLILFNVHIPQETFYEPTRTENGDYQYKNTILDKLWKNGFSNISEANWNTISYVARYVTKKQKGILSEEEYAAKGQRPEFFRVSNRPAIGKAYYDKHKEEIYKYDKILVKNKKGSHYIKPPKYFDKLYEAEYPERMKEIKRKRKRQLINNLLIKGEKTSLNAWEQLQIEEEAKKDQCRIFNRDKKL